MRRGLFLAALLPLGGCIVHEHREVPRPAEPPLTRDEALRLVQAGLSEPVVVELVLRRGVEPLDAAAVAELSKAGAPDALLQRMITAARVPPPPEPEPVYVELVDPWYAWRPWYPTIGFGFGFGGYRSYGHRTSRGIRIYR